jgi:lysyl-tRNA synthetase class 2
MKVYMRISNELYLKRLIVGGYEKVFEFSRDFRNEGIDTEHNPEFEQVETMWAYANYQDNMKFCEEMVEFLAKKIFGTTKIKCEDEIVDVKAPWQRLRMFDAVKKSTKIDFDKITSVQEARKAAEKLGLDVGKCETVGEIAMNIFEEKAMPNLIQPTIVYDYPAEIFGLAKIKEEDKRFAEAFEPVINGMELGLSYSEENNPQKLQEYWKAAEEHFKKGDTEAQRMDLDFIRALEYGMPPTSGLGFGIDRAAIIFSNSGSIRDVIFFPTLRPEK